MKVKPSLEFNEHLSVYSVQLLEYTLIVTKASRSFKDFVLESNKHGQINFVGSKSEATDNKTESHPVNRFNHTATISGNSNPVNCSSV